MIATVLPVRSRIPRSHAGQPEQFLPVRHRVQHAQRLTRSFPLSLPAARPATASSVPSGEKETDASGRLSLLSGERRGLLARSSRPTSTRLRPCCGRRCDGGDVFAVGGKGRVPERPRGSRPVSVPPYPLSRPTAARARSSAFGGGRPVQEPLAVRGELGVSGRVRRGAGSRIGLAGLRVEQPHERPRLLTASVLPSGENTAEANFSPSFPPHSNRELARVRVPHLHSLWTGPLSCHCAVSTSLLSGENLMSFAIGCLSDARVFQVPTSQRRHTMFPRTFAVANSLLSGENAIAAPKSSGSMSVWTCLPVAASHTATDRIRPCRRSDSRPR